MANEHLIPQYKIGEEVKDTMAYGTVVVRDIFRSTTGPWFCYRVELKENGESVMAQEEELDDTYDESLD
jgi:hypothetical protein